MGLTTKRVPLYDSAMVPGTVCTRKRAKYMEMVRVPKILGRLDLGFGFLSVFVPVPPIFVFICRLPFPNVRSVTVRVGGRGI